MLSATFVDRPRLAIVIALVTTIAGLLSLLYLGKYQRSRRASPAIGPGAMAVAESQEAALERGALQLGLSIAAGIGLTR